VTYGRSVVKHHKPNLTSIENSKEYLNGEFLIISLLQALKMIHNIRDAFNELLEANKWMDDDTKSVAKEKVN